MNLIKRIFISLIITAGFSSFSMAEDSPTHNEMGIPAQSTHSYDLQRAEAPRLKGVLKTIKMVKTELKGLKKTLRTHKNEDSDELQKSLIVMGSLSIALGILAIISLFVGVNSLSIGLIILGILLLIMALAFLLVTVIQAIILLVKSTKPEGKKVNPKANPLDPGKEVEID